MLTKTNLQFFFPTVIGHSYEQDLAEKTLPAVKTALADESLLTNQWGYKNTYTTSKGLEILPQFEEVAKFIELKSYAYLQSIGYEPKQDLSVNIFVSGMEEGDWHDRHCHPGAILSGVFYLECPEGSSNIIFYDPRTFRDSRSTLIAIKDSEITSDSAVFKPSNGLFLIWESWIHHQVTHNKSKTPRVTLVFNIG